MRDQEHNRSRPLHHHDKHAAHKSGHRPDDPHGVTAMSAEEEYKEYRKTNPLDMSSDESLALRQNWLDEKDAERNRFNQIRDAAKRMDSD